MTMRASFSIECCNDQSGGEAKRLQQTALLLKTYHEAPGESIPMSCATAASRAYDKR
jgi:hypothetical protein